MLIVEACDAICLIRFVPPDGALNYGLRLGPARHLAAEPAWIPVRYGARR